MRPRRISRACIFMYILYIYCVRARIILSAHEINATPVRISMDTSGYARGGRNAFTAKTIVVSTLEVVELITGAPGILPFNELARPRPPPPPCTTTFAEEWRGINNNNNSKRCKNEKKKSNGHCSVFPPRPYFSTFAKSLSRSERRSEE